MMAHKGIDHESVLHMNNLVSFPNPQTKRNEQDEYCVVLLGSKNYHKEGIACEKRLEMGAIFQRVATATKEPVGTVLTLNGAETKCLVAYLLNVETELSKFFPLALELDGSIDTIANGLLVPLKVPNAMNVVFPGDNPLAKCLSNDNDLEVVTKYVLTTPSRSAPSPPPSPIKRMKQKPNKKKRSVNDGDISVKKHLFKKKKTNPKAVVDIDDYDEVEDGVGAAVEVVADTDDDAAGADTEEFFSENDDEFPEVLDE